ncbi:unnamed protein product [Paramecium octaurelia]|uniref:Protein kinase domain-containing protein n=1 Tax=Paramecium octaurelia TaxID=43137 RepID=A0A8S1Y5J2_PAROT|nr:unnamed protein product [Paramecium octaurelia]
MDQNPLPNGFQLEPCPPKQGVNGDIFTCSKDGNLYAMKIFKKNKEQYLHEVNICTTLKSHVNIIKLIDNFEWQGNRVIILEYCSNDLISYLNQNPHLSELERLNIFAQIVSAFKSIIEDLNSVEMHFSHRDIKPENLMLGDDNMIKIIDFGESRIFDNDNQIPTLKNQLYGTHGYMDPIMEFGGDGFQEKSDLWSMGATLYYILKNERLQINSKDIYQSARMIQPDKTVSQNQSDKTASKILSEKRKQAKLDMVQEIINQSLIQLPFSDQCKDLLDKLLRVDHNIRYGWNQLFENELIKQLLESLPQGQMQQKNDRKKPIKLSYQMNKDFLSMNFKQQAGPILTETLYVIISKGKQCASTANEMFKYFNQMKFVNEDFMNNWQNFEKCNYLLHLRSLIILNHYNQIFTLKTPKSGQESIDSKLFEDLTNGTQQNQQIYDRIQLQVYYLFEDVRKSLQGSGLETRILNLTKLSSTEVNEYNQTLDFTEEEREYFQYRKDDKMNVKNRPDYFDKPYFYEIYKSYLLKCIKVLINNYDKDGVSILSDMIISYKLEEFYEKCTQTKIQNYLYNQTEQNKEVFYAKLKAIYNSLIEK